MNTLVSNNERIQRTTYNTRRADGTAYTVTVTPAGYILDGVTFATLAAALTAARTAHERRAK